MDALLSRLFTLAAGNRRYWSNRTPRGEGVEYAASYGSFVPTYWVFYRRPRTDDEAQRLYNHARTVAWYLDALPWLAKSGLPFQVGFDDIVSFIPIYGDLIGSIASLYQIFLAWLFGVPRVLLGRMLLNVIIDTLLGFIPIIGDFLDVFFKSNLRNLELLENWLLHDETAKRAYSVSMPPSDVFLPKLSATRRRTRASPGTGDPRAKYRNRPRTARTRPDDDDDLD